MRWLGLGGLLLGCAVAADGKRPVTAPAVPSAAAPLERWAVPEASTAPRELLRYYERHGVCQADEGCPFQGAPVPECTRFEIEPVAPGKAGRRVRVGGRLSAVFGARQSRGCGGRPCCNAHWGPLAVSTGEGSVFLGADKHLSRENPLNCVGDDSAMCCGFAAIGEDVIAEGELVVMTFVEQGVERHLYRLVMSGVCRVTSKIDPPTNMIRSDAALPPQ